MNEDCPGLAGAETAVCRNAMKALPVERERASGNRNDMDGHLHHGGGRCLCEFASCGIGALGIEVDSPERSEDLERIARAAGSAIMLRLLFLLFLCSHCRRPCLIQAHQIPMCLLRHYNALILQQGTLHRAPISYSSQSHHGFSLLLPAA
jgi:hypothetical protein